MVNYISRNTLRFIFLVLFQVLILNNIQFIGYINPYFYVLFILLLPFETPKWLLLVLAFVLGLSIDMFSNTMGMHAAASVFMAFCRPYLLHYIAPRGGYEFESKPTIPHLGLNWYLSYSGILVLLHHLVLFYIEVFHLSEFFSTFYRVVISFCLTMILIIISQYLLYGKKK
ncbi:MAG: rod shape-determining protein MreD [Bacteroidota bacterium]